MIYLSGRIAGLMFLGGCACQNAIEAVEKSAAERPAFALMPQTCGFSGEFNGSVQALTCEDGRQGFIVVGSE